MKRFFLHVYTGNGKGKTTASIGLAVRAYGRSKRVCVIHFLKNQESGEDIALKKLGIPVFHYGIEGFFNPSKPPEKLKRIVKEGMEGAIKLINSGKYEIIILDEANYCFFAGLYPVKEFLKAIKEKRCEVVLTGRNAPRELIDAADLVTEMREVKHYYNGGIEAREGIEF